MRPLIMTAGKRPVYDPNQRRITIQFMFPDEGRGEKGETDLINGDMPRIIVKAGPEVQVELERPEAKEMTGEA